MSKANIALGAQQSLGDGDCRPLVRAGLSLLPFLPRPTHLLGSMSVEMFCFLRVGLERPLCREESHSFSKSDKIVPVT